MSKLQKFSAKICYTASGMLVHEGKVLLVKHKKLGFWLNPGGHIDEDELPHKTAEREFLEETGIRVRALTLYQNPNSTESEYLPLPILTNLHWVNRESYNKRVFSSDQAKRVETKVWPRGCEQHLNYMYLVEPVKDVEFKLNSEESDDIAWFLPEEIEDLETIDDIKSEINYGFQLMGIE